MNTRPRSCAPTGHSTAGPERKKFEQVFTVELLDRLNAALFRLPAPRRGKRRTEIYGAVLCNLPDGFPIEPSDPKQNCREHLLAAIEILEREAVIAALES
jgi:N-methylhydantoinase B